jgi:hypothetical protein
MRTAIRLFALALALGTIAFWFFGGPHLGWTRTQVEVDTVDSVTGLTGKTWERRFVPGVDFLATGLALAAVSFGASFAFRRRVLEQ